MSIDYPCDRDLVVLRSRPTLWALRWDAIEAVWVEDEGTTLKHIAFDGFDGKDVFLKPAKPELFNSQAKARADYPRSLQ